MGFCTRVFVALSLRGARCLSAGSPTPSVIGAPIVHNCPQLVHSCVHHCAQVCTNCARLCTVGAQRCVHICCTNVHQLCTQRCVHGRSTIVCQLCNRGCAPVVHNWCTICAQRCVQSGICRQALSHVFFDGSLASVHLSIVPYGYYIIIFGVLVCRVRFLEFGTNRFMLRISEIACIPSHFKPSPSVTVLAWTRAGRLLGRSQHAMGTCRNT